MKHISTLFFLLLTLQFSAQQIQMLETGTNASFRGLHMLNDSVWWASGQRNTVISTTNAGKTWTHFRVGDTTLLTDFRDIHVLGPKEVVVAGAGSPSLIYRTTDGGVTWRKVYENRDSLAFIDAIDFWDSRNGIAVADPIEGKWQILLTSNGGDSWSLAPAEQLPAALPNEAAFAASGTCLRAFGSSEVALVTGGSNFARLLLSSDRGMSWKHQGTELPATASSGLFSVAKNDRGDLVCVGGDYVKQESKMGNAVLIDRTLPEVVLRVPVAVPNGYRCGLALAQDQVMIATGDGGTDISYDSGITWSAFDQQGFYTVSCFRGSCIFAGKQGKFGFVPSVHKK